MQEATQLAENIHWVGAIDWGVRDFHGYSTDRGTTYNAYLIIDEKITLIDTVKRNYKNELLDRIRKIIPPERIDYLVVNHVEMDHSGCVDEIIEAIKPEKVFVQKWATRPCCNIFTGMTGRITSSRRARS